ncbi:hypothetical protein LLS04_06755 [Erysipelothrix enhydrae]|uniref:hypothetical protein n=1 Tax=Erysipelothrix enhydrae TaxID=2890314 RepID=UPI002B247F01|nr:hypothetical protein [Erysipelothrix sp. 4322-04]WRB86671.1 hypothetical protein LLS04_06755 [Erysipelothrix sp. 4322-04]
MSNLEFTNTDGSMKFDTITTNELKCHEDDFMLINAEFLQSIGGLFDTITDALMPLHRFIEVAADRIIEFLDTIKEILDFIFKKAIDSSIANLDWNLYFPSFSTETFDVSVPPTGPPTENDNYENEKELFKITAFKIFAYFVIFDGIVIALNNQVQIMNLISSVIGSNPFVAFCAPTVLTFIFWILPDDFKKKIKDRVQSLFNFF